MDTRTTDFGRIDLIINPAYGTWNANLHLLKQILNKITNRTYILAQTNQ